MTFDMQKARSEKRVTAIYDHLYPDALDEIDAQAASLDAAEALIRKNAETINGQAKQIATLKAALISDRSKLLFLFKDRIFGIPEMINGSDKFKENAIKKLAQEYPEIFTEEKE